jgi:hypothetical protein
MKKQKIINILALCLITVTAYSGEYKVEDLPKPVLKVENGPDIGRTDKVLEGRYGRNWGKGGQLIFTFNLLEKNSLDVMALMNDGKAVLVSYAASKQQDTTLGDEVIEFLVKKNFPKAKWKIHKDPRVLRISTKAFESDDGKYTWILRKDRKQLLLSVKKE